MTKQKPSSPTLAPREDISVLPTAEAMMRLLHDTGEQRPPTFDAAAYATKRLAAAAFITFLVFLDEELEEEPVKAKIMAGELRALAGYLDPATRDEARAALSRFNGRILEAMVRENDLAVSPAPLLDHEKPAGGNSAIENGRPGRRKDQESR